MNNKKSLFIEVTIYCLWYKYMSKTINLHSAESLIRLIRLKDESAFNQVYKNCRDYCINFLKSNGVNNENAIDIFQDAMIVLYEKNN